MRTSPILSEGPPGRSLASRSATSSPSATPSTGRGIDRVHGGSSRRVCGAPPQSPRRHRWRGCFSAHRHDGDVSSHIGTPRPAGRRPALAYPPLFERFRHPGDGDDAPRPLPRSNWHRDARCCRGAGRLAHVTARLDVPTSSWRSGTCCSSASLLPAASRRPRGRPWFSTTSDSRVRPQDRAGSSTASRSCSSPSPRPPRAGGSLGLVVRHLRSSTPLREPRSGSRATRALTGRCSSFPQASRTVGQSSDEMVALTSFRSKLPYQLGVHSKRSDSLVLARLWGRR